MEREVVVVCSIVVLLGILSATLGFVAEAIRMRDSQFNNASDYCAYPQTPLPFRLALAAVLAILISQIVLNVSAGFICWICSPRFSQSTWEVALMSFIISWSTFVAAIIGFLNGVLFGSYNCWRPGGFATGAIMSLGNSVFGIVYYLTLTAAGKNGSGSSYPNPILEGIAMERPQIPQISQDPVFVHEDTYNRRQFP